MPPKKTTPVATAAPTVASTATAPTTAPTTAPKVAPTAVKAATKAIAPTAVAVPVATATVAVPVVTGTEESDADDESLAVLLEKFSSIQTLVKEFHGLLKAHQKVFNKLQKQSKKAERKRAAARKTQSGFAKPSKLSDELCEFLKVDGGTEMARTAVTKLITNYIKTNSLNDKVNKRKIIPDALLQKLLNYKPGTSEELTYFNLQRYMKHHFVKAAAAAAAVVVPAAEVKPVA